MLDSLHRCWPGQSCATEPCSGMRSTLNMLFVLSKRAPVSTNSLDRLRPIHKTRALGLPLDARRNFWEATWSFCQLLCVRFSDCVEEQLSEKHAKMVPTLNAGPGGKWDCAGRGLDDKGGRN